MVYVDVVLEYFVDFVVVGIYGWIYCDVFIKSEWGMKSFVVFIGYGEDWYVFFRVCYVMCFDWVIVLGLLCFWEVGSNLIGFFWVLFFLVVVG